MESREIHIGDQTYPITRFKGLKASIAGALMSRVMREVPQLQERTTEFRKRFRESNKISITPAMAKLPRFAALELTTEDFQAVGGNIELPEEPDQGTLLINMFPDLFDLARKELQLFFGLLVIPNSELEDADDEGQVDEALNKYGKRLMRQGDLDELLDLVVIGAEVFKDQMASKRDRLGKIPIPWLQRILNPEDEEETEEPTDAEAEEIAAELASNGHGETSPTPTETNQPPPPSSPPSSSTDSQPSSDGDEEKSSSESLGTSSSG